MPTVQGRFLPYIASPGDLKRLREEDLPELCREVRQFIIDVISSNPGHLGASLGTIELTVALHYAFNTPYDKVIWDVGHQAYAHKILTGRRDVFHTNRMYHGISGFPRMSESEYDAFGVGHSSTSVSAALGMAEASRLAGETDRRHIAVIGDGAMTGGMAMEALNNAGVSNANILVILNDNGIAIDKNVGAIHKYLTDITTSRAYNRFRDKVWIMMGGHTRYGANSRAVVKQIGNALKTSILKKSNMFEAFNFRYFGPVDGHDVIRLTKLLNDLKNIPGPKLLHIITVKGKGFESAERDQTTYHAPGVFNKQTGELASDPCQGKPPRFQTVFGRTIIELAEMNQHIVGITPAMPTGCSLNLMMKKMPERVYDVGIAEQHAVTFSAGLAASGKIPYCNIYSTFMQRAYDQVIHDVALQKLQVVFCLDRAGLVGEDGATHHGAFDLAYLRAIPNMTIASPMNEIELRNLMYTAQLPGKGPFAIRYPRGRGVISAWKVPFEEIAVGTGRLLRDGKDLLLVSIGPVGNQVAQVCENLAERGISCAHADLRFLKPLDVSLLHRLLSKHSRVISIEDGSIQGGMGSALLEFIHEHDYQVKVRRLGIPDSFIEQGDLETLHAVCGFDEAGILNAALGMMGQS
ncbi:MAG TPA: 1-deoxy-D-xylulose-5-phosphate synthase [Bacteroidales bacterium]|nr:1-deoxy-D-xylulose-5-phosphate synthase [Bacteroidales bacterium]HSA42986.1 1-deoxy-D-xylulose-5-phosphate synthase [Bacteroidales bacterium]